MFVGHYLLSLDYSRSNLLITLPRLSHLRSLPLEFGNEIEEMRNLENLEKWIKSFNHNQNKQKEFGIEMKSGLKCNIQTREL